MLLTEMPGMRPRVPVRAETSSFVPSTTREDLVVRAVHHEGNDGHAAVPVGDAHAAHDEGAVLGQGLVDLLDRGQVLDEDADEPKAFIGITHSGYSLSNNFRISGNTSRERFKVPLNSAMATP